MSSRNENPPTRERGRTSVGPKSDGTAIAPGRVDPPGAPPPPSSQGERSAGAKSGPAPGQRIGLIWTAVSEDKGQTTEGQEAALREQAAAMGLYVPEEFVYRVTASRFMKNPPEKDEVLELARRRKFHVLLVWRLDRWARDRKRGVREVFEILPASGVKVVSLQERFLSTDGLPDFYREWIGDLVLYLAEDESRGKSERTKLRYAANRNRAQAGGGKAKWGRGRIPTLEERARVIELHRAGLSQRKIAAETGVPRSTVQRILDEPVAQS